MEQTGEEGRLTVAMQQVPNRDVVELAGALGLEVFEAQIFTAARAIRRGTSVYVRAGLPRSLAQRAVSEAIVNWLFEEERRPHGPGTMALYSDLVDYLESWGSGSFRSERDSTFRAEDGSQSLAPSNSTFAEAR